jgi:DNA mismatch repair protein MutS
LASKDKEVKETPLMKQYNEIKRKYPDACLLFRVGDFTKHSEKMLSGLQKIGITLTKRGAVLQQRPHWLVFHIIL